MTVRIAKGLKDFIRLANGKALASPLAFLDAHQEFLNEQGLKTLTDPIIAQLQDRKLVPGMALKAVRDVVFAHMLDESLKESKAKMERANAPREARTTKPFTAVLLTDEGKIALRKTEEGDTVAVISSFETEDEARRWCDRRLANDSGPNWTATVTDNRTQRVVVVDRDAAFGRAFAKRLGGASALKVKGVGDTKWRMRVRNDVAKFSHG